MRWGRGTRMFAVALLLKAGFWMGQTIGNPYPLADYHAARHPAELRQIVLHGAQTEQEQEIARWACAAVLVESWLSD